jgi:hypothetical protein
VVVFFNFLINLNENDVFKALNFLLFSHNLGGGRGVGVSFFYENDFFYENSNWWLGNRIFLVMLKILITLLLISKL